MTEHPNLYTSHKLPPRVALTQMLAGSRVRQLLYVAAKLRIAELLIDGPKSVATLANQADADPTALERVMRALAAVGVFRQLEDGRFEVAAVGRYLQPGLPGSLHAVAAYAGPEAGALWDGLLEALKTGGPAFNRAFGVGFFEYLSQDAEAAQAFDRRMASIAEGIAPAVLSAYDFSRYHTVVDIGGGRGALMVSILNRNPRLRGVVFDVPSVIPGARQAVTTAGLQHRCEVVAGDFFDSVPQGGDLYVLSHVLHDWDDDRALVILKNSRRAMPPEGRLLVIEQLVPTNGDIPLEVAISDINMLILTSGRDRTEPEYRALLDAAGFVVTNVVSTEATVSLLEGVPA